MPVQNLTGVTESINLKVPNYSTQYVERIGYRVCPALAINRVTAPLLGIEQMTDLSFPNFIHRYHNNVKDDLNRVTLGYRPG